MRLVSISTLLADAALRAATATSLDEPTTELPRKKKNSGSKIRINVTGYGSVHMVSSTQMRTSEEPNAAD